MDIFEILMLICFGFAWPTSIYKSITSKSIKGKSVLFLYVVIAGYLFGIVHKIINDPNFVISLYAVNATMVFIDLMLYYRNKKLLKVKNV
jgi:ABC-type multidrug transport system permease subunit